VSQANFTSGQPTTYDHALWTGSARWRGILAIVLLIASFFVVSTLITVLAMTFQTSIGSTGSADLTTLTPVVLLSINLSIAAQWPIAVFLQWCLFGVPPRWMSSVEGTFRWGWLGRLSLFLLPLYVAFAVLSLILTPLGPLRFDGSTIVLAVIVLLSTPLQAAGEEFAVRGLVQRSISSWFHDTRAALFISTGLSSLVFAIMHASPDGWRAGYYIAFGVAASMAAWGTGGLEAAILIHSLNNLVILAPAALTGGLEAHLDRGGSESGPLVLVPMAILLLAALLSVWLAKRLRLVTRTRMQSNAKDAGGES